TKRPVNLDLSTVKFPITAIASILHRICAVISWVGLGFLIMILGYVLSSAEQYNTVAALYKTNFLLKFVSWGFLAAFGYYCMGTIKHIIQDFGFFEDFSGGQFISWSAIIAGVALALLAGVLVW
ncbi:MAG: succinate dehydrogenase, cytochrome b556 subunit, partial [Pseudomonadota bacterium]